MSEIGHIVKKEFLQREAVSKGMYVTLGENNIMEIESSWFFCVDFINRTFSKELIQKLSSLPAPVIDIRLLTAATASFFKALK